MRSLRIWSILFVVVFTGLTLGYLSPLVSVHRSFRSRNLQPTGTLNDYKFADAGTSELAVYYINLGSRLDRKKSIVKQLGFLGLPFSRMEAVDFRGNETALRECWDEKDSQRCAGKLGCKASHMKVLELHEKDELLRSVVIFEDDFVWLGHVNPSRFPWVLKGFESLFPDWKVLGLSMNIMHQKLTNVSVQLSKDIFHVSQVTEISEAQTTHGYAVRASYIPVLLAVWRECDVTARLDIAIDQCWKPLQAQGGWYAFSPQLGTQKPGFSDIESMEVNYDIS